MDPESESGRKRRTVLREPGLEIELVYLLKGDWQSVEATLSTVERVLSLHPDLGTPIGEGVWILPLAPAYGLDLWLYYVAYSEVVVLLEVQGFTSED